MDWVKKRYVHPNVIVRGSALVEESCQANGVNIVQLLRPFSEFKGTLYAHTGERAELVTINGFGVRFVYESCIRETDAAVRARCTRELLDRNAGSDAANSDQLDDILDRSGLLNATSHTPNPRPVHLASAQLLSSLTQRAGSPWHQDFVRLYHYAIRCGYFDTLDHPVGVLYVISSRDILAHAVSPACSQRERDESRGSSRASEHANPVSRPNHDNNNSTTGAGNNTNNSMSNTSSNNSSAHTTNCTTSGPTHTAQGVVPAFQQLTQSPIDIYTDMPSMDNEMHQYFIIVHDMRFAEPSLETAQVALAIAQRQFGPNNCALLKINSNTTPQSANSGSGRVDPAPWVEANAVRMMDVMAARHTMSPTQQSSVLSSSTVETSKEALGNDESIPYVGSAVGHSFGRWPDGQAMITGCYLSHNDVVELTRLVEHYLARSLMTHLERRLRTLDVSVQERRSTALSKVTAWFKSRDEVRPTANVVLVRRAPASRGDGGGRTYSTQGQDNTGSSVSSSPHTSLPKTHVLVHSKPTMSGLGAAETIASSSVYMYRAPSLELQMRRCGDLSLFLQNYAGASSYYKMCLDELIETLGERVYNRVYIAGCQEAMALANLFMGKLSVPSLTPWATSMTHRDFKGKGAVCRLEVAHNDYMNCGLSHYALRTSLIMYELTRATVPPATRRTRAVLQYALASGELSLSLSSSSSSSSGRAAGQRAVGAGAMSRSNSAVVLGSEQTDDSHKRRVSSSTLTPATTASTTSSSSHSHNSNSDGKSNSPHARRPDEAVENDVGCRAILYDMLAGTLLFANPPRPTGTSLAPLGMPEDYLTYAYLRQFVQYSILAGVHYYQAGAFPVALRCLSRALHLLHTPGTPPCGWEWLYEYVLLTRSKMLVRVHRDVEAVAWLSLALTRGTPSYRGHSRIHAHSRHASSSSSSSSSRSFSPPSTATVTHTSRSSRVSIHTGPAAAHVSPTLPARRVVRHVEAFWQQLRRVLAGVGFALCPHMPVPCLVAHSLVAESHAYDMDAETQYAEEQAPGGDMWGEMEDVLGDYYAQIMQGYAHSLYASDTRSEVSVRKDAATRTGVYTSALSSTSISASASASGSSSLRATTGEQTSAPRHVETTLHEPLMVSVTLYNPLGVRLVVEHICLLYLALAAPSQLWKSHVSRTLDIAPGASQRVRVPFEPHEEGDYVLVGWGWRVAELDGYRYFAHDDTREPVERVFAAAMAHPAPRLSAKENVWVTVKPARARLRANFDPPLPHSRFSHGHSHSNHTDTDHRRRTHTHHSHDDGPNGNSSDRVWLDGECFETTLCIHNRSRVQAAGSVMLQRHIGTAHLIHMADEELGCWQPHREQQQQHEVDEEKKDSERSPIRRADDAYRPSYARMRAAPPPLCVAQQILPGATVRLRVTIRPQCNAEHSDAEGGCWNDLSLLIGYMAHGRVLQHDNGSATREQGAAKDDTSPHSPVERVIQRHRLRRRIRVWPLLRVQTRVLAPCNAQLCAVAVMTVSHVGRDEDEKDEENESSGGRRAQGAASRMCAVRVMSVTAVQRAPARWAVRAIDPRCPEESSATAAGACAGEERELRERANEKADVSVQMTRNVWGHEEEEQDDGAEKESERSRVMTGDDVKDGKEEGQRAELAAATRSRRAVMTAEETVPHVPRASLTRKNVTAVRTMGQIVEASRTQSPAQTAASDNASQSSAHVVLERASKSPTKGGQVTAITPESVSSTPQSAHSMRNEPLCTLRAKGYGYTLPLSLHRRSSPAARQKDSHAADGQNRGPPLTHVGADEREEKPSRIAAKSTDFHVTTTLHQPATNAYSTFSSAEPIHFVQQSCLFSSAPCDEMDVTDAGLLQLLATSHRGPYCREPIPRPNDTMHNDADLSNEEERRSHVREAAARRVMGLAFYRDGGGSSARRVGSPASPPTQTAQKATTTITTAMGENERISNSHERDERLISYAPVGLMLRWEMVADEGPLRSGWLFHFIDPTDVDTSLPLTDEGRICAAESREQQQQQQQQQNQHQHQQRAAWRQRRLCRALITGLSAPCMGGGEAGALYVHSELCYASVNTPRRKGTTHEPAFPLTATTDMAHAWQVVGACERDAILVTHIRALTRTPGEMTVAVTPACFFAVNATAAGGGGVSSKEVNSGEAELRVVGTQTRRVRIRAGERATVRHRVCLPTRHAGVWLTMLPTMRVSVISSSSSSNNNSIDKSNNSNSNSVTHGPSVWSSASPVLCTGESHMQGVPKPHKELRVAVACSALTSHVTHEHSYSSADTDSAEGPLMLRQMTRDARAWAVARRVPSARWLFRPRVLVDVSESGVDYTRQNSPPHAGDGNVLPGQSGSWSRTGVVGLTEQQTRIRDASVWGVAGRGETKDGITRVRRGGGWMADAATGQVEEGTGAAMASPRLTESWEETSLQSGAVSRTAAPRTAPSSPSKKEAQ